MRGGTTAAGVDMRCRFRSVTSGAQACGTGGSMCFGVVVDLGGYDSVWRGLVLRVVFTRGLHVILRGYHHDTVVVIVGWLFHHVCMSWCVAGIDSSSTWWHVVNPSALAGKLVFYRHSLNMSIVVRQAATAAPFRHVHRRCRSRCRRLLHIRTNC
ncbi:hypothetical protein H257_13281 [Aphanomyces astaci]|uniref:Uncharacterized protein n=1 Tax=Aphanomyces astaci TaxID=112090 RepID=W4FWR7_APHAT|nr:hypothetical protein H257_13281 [Aphanomyces astaci]ETV71386.1 hypothetical protein H257_13281 [Aphanomyces astaci]|eukprot:XP_009839051.1 hypothetical protein H257_13281 [Aphanomyces astaci]